MVTHFHTTQLIRLSMLITLALYTCFSSTGYAQFGPDTVKNELNQPDTNSRSADTLVGKVDSADTGFDLESEVRYKASDSIRFEVKSQRVFLYGKAEVFYETQELKADYMEIDMKKNEVLALGKADSTGKVTEKVKFKDGENEMEATKIVYNMKSKKGKVYEVLTTEGEGYIHMAEAKKQDNDEVHLRKGKYTTCSNENPHYHFRLSKAIVIPDDKIVTGPLYMVLGKKIITPLALPFGYFPNRKGSVHGIIIPQYGDSKTYGFFLQNGGYYLPVGKHADMQFLGDIYSRGSWALKQITRYKWKYRFNGNINLSFTQFKLGEKEFPDFSKSNEFFVRWTHMQDMKARPGSKFSANVNFGTQSNFQNNFNTVAQDYLSSSFQSNVSYSKTWLGTPFSLSTNLRHNQNRLSRNVTVTVPELTFNVNRFFPFERKNAVGKKRFYENIGVTYSANARNDVSATDTLFSMNNISTLLNKYGRNGIRHNAAVSSTFKFFGQRFTFNPNISMSERWYLSVLNKTFNGSELTTDTLNQFGRNFECSFNASITTRIFGMYSTRKSGGPKLRHIFTPSINFSYRPDFNTNQEVQSDILGNTVTYSPYELGVFGRPGAGESGTIGLSFMNSLEMKKRSLKDTVTGYVKIPIIENFQVNANYDLVRDSMNLSNIQFTARNTFFKVLGIVYSSSLDPYYYENGKITRFYFAEKGGSGLGRITSNNLAVSYTFSAKERKDKSKKKNLTDAEKEEAEAINRNKSAYVNFNVPLTISVAYNLNFSRQFIGTLDTVLMTQSVNLNTDFSITRKLKLGVNTNYDFVAKEISYTELDLYYDLHCWEFSVNVIPFGLRKSYTVTLNVKASILQDLRLQRRRSWIDLQ